MKIIISQFATILLIGLVGCKGGSGGGGGSTDDAPDLSTPITVTVKGGNGFECFLLGGSLYCRGVSPNLDINLNTTDFIEYTYDSDSDLLSLETWFVQVSLNVSATL